MTDQIPLRQLDQRDALSPKGTQPEEFDLYHKREKIYTRKIEGFFQRLRLFTGWPLLIGFFGLPWISWDGRQSILFDLPARQFHIFGTTFWPQDFSLLAWLLIIAAFGLFFVTTWLGRIWCGYTCPQTVWTSIFMWCEQVTEGDRNARIKIDKNAWTVEKFIRKGLKHSLWIGFALLTSVSFVGYFSPIAQLSLDMLTFNLGPWEAFWLLFFLVATYGNAGWLREQVCLYMCPYARFQGAMFDKNTLIVSYDPQRGESRGARKRDTDYKAAGLGDCIDCQLCVQVCPTGIDIRDGLQYECINCALCIDACDSMMDKMNYPRGLIAYTTENRLEGNKGGLLRPKLIGYGTALLLMSALFVGSLVQRVPLELDIIRDRSQLFRITDYGKVENTYTIKIMNMSQQPEQYKLSVSGLEQFELKGTSEVTIAPGEVRTLPIVLETDPDTIKQRNNTISFTVTASGRNMQVTEESRFIGPWTP